MSAQYKPLLEKILTPHPFRPLVLAGTAALVVLIIFLLTLTDHISNTATNTNTISFSGEGKIFAVPDIAVVSFSIITEAPTSKKAQDNNSEKSNQVIKFLKDQGIEDRDIKTSSYNVYPQYNYPRPCPLSDSQYDITYPCVQNETKITGYQVNQTFEVKIRDLEKVSTILDGLVSAGANQVNNLGFKVDNEEGLKEQAREMAIKDAKEKANKLKKQLGIRLGKIVNYSEGGNYPPFYLKAEALDSRGGGVGGDGPIPSVPAGENEIIVNITITYQIR